MKKFIVLLICCSFLLISSKGESSTINTIEETGYFDDTLIDSPFDWEYYNNLGEWNYGLKEYNLPLFDGYESASLTLILGGAGFNRPAKVYLNGFFLGQATSGDGGMYDDNVYRSDTWVLSQEVSESLNINTKLLVDAHEYDGWVFMKLSISGFRESGDNVDPTAPVPEPATMLLFATGLAGLTAIRRKKVN